jgi:hypothetical protein
MDIHPEVRVLLKKELAKFQEIALVIHVQDGVHAG